MRKALVRNPAWANKIIADTWAQLQKDVPQWLPRLEAVEAAGSGKITGEPREYGCGAYGCVYPTIAPNVVMKMTTDDTEAEFAAKIAPTLVRPICTEYYKVVSLLDVPDNPYIYLLWREEASLVGKLYVPLIEDYGNQRADELYGLIDIQHRNAQIAYAIMGDERDDYIQIRTFVQKLSRGQRAMLEDGNMADAVNAWVASVADLAVCDVPYLSELFTGVLDVYHHQHVFFGDLHDGNMGAVWRGQGDDRKIYWVVTDPGHVAVIDF